MTSLSLIKLAVIHDPRMLPKRRDTSRGLMAFLIKDKDIILLLGNTGVGKSTLMHYLAGSKMRPTKVNGIPHLVPEEVMSGLEDVKFSCTSRSVTTGIHAITMNMNGETYIVCDTAGFGDTRAVEDDIASGIVMINAIRTARSVKLALVMGAETRLIRLLILRNNLIPAIIKLIPSFKNYVGSVFYLFNMISYPMETIAAILREINTSLTDVERADADFAAMVSDLAKKSTTGTHAAVTDLINADRTVHQKLLRDLNAVEPILHPEKVFCHFAATTSISILNQQLNLHKAAISRGFDRFEASGSNADLLLVDYKLRQLLDLHLLVGLPECEGCYTSSLEATYRFVQKLHCKTFQRVQSWFEDDRASDSDIDAELSTCIQQVLLLFEVESIRHVHDGLIVDSDEGLGSLNVREIILALFLRMQKDCKSIVDTHFENILSASDADTNSMISSVASIVNGNLASSKLTKMRILSSVLQQGNYNFGMGPSCSLTYNHCFTSIFFTELEENQALAISEVIQIAFTDMIQLYLNLATEIRETISSIIDAIQSSIQSKSYITGLPSLQRLMSLEVFNLTVKINGAEPTVRLQTLFFESIIFDCEEAKTAIDSNIFDSAETFNHILHQVLAVSARSDFNEEIGGVVAAQESLIAHIGLACDRAKTEFQTMFAEHDVGIYSKIIGKVATIDLLRSHELVLHKTSGKYHALTDAVKTSLESYSKEAIRVISDISTMQSTDILAPTNRMEEKNAVSLKRLLILINDASTFEGSLHSAYKSELNHVMDEMYKMSKVLSDHAVKGENGITISFKSHSNLKSLHFKRSAVCSLRQAIAGCVDSMPVLAKVSNMMTTVVVRCDTVVARAAMEGIMQQ